MIAATTSQPFPWPLIPGLIGFFIAFFVQFRLKYHVDREKVLALKDMSELYSTGMPPRKLLTEHGRRLHTWLFVGGAAFAASGLFCILLYAH
jgi:hypothetical protein